MRKKNNFFSSHNIKMATRSRSSVRAQKSRSVGRKSRSPMRSKSPRKMRSKSPRKMRSTRRMKKTGTRKSAPKSEYQKYVKAHKAEITAAVKAAGHSGKGFIGHFTKMAKKMAMEAGVQMKMKGKAMKRGTMTRRRRASGLRKFKAGSMSQSAEQKLRALFSRSPSKYTLTKRGSRVMKKRSAKKVKGMKKTRKSRAPTQRNLFFKNRKAEINAEVARRGMKGVRGAFIKVGSEMAKASGY